MIIVAKILATLILVVWLLRKHVQIGHAMLAGSAILFLLASPTFGKAFIAVRSTVMESSTWEVVLAMFFVMCLEHLLRTSGTIAGFMSSMKSLLRSDRVLLAFMPAFLGLLPSLGGAIFSAPMVEHASKNYSLSPEKKATINYWFRHIWEYANPIIPGVLLASQITSIPLSSFVAHMAGYTLIALVLGLVFILTGKGFRSEKLEDSLREAPTSDSNSLNSDSAKTSTISTRYLCLALGPILVNIIFVVYFHLSAAISMGLVVFGMAFLLRLDKYKVIKMLTESFDRKLLWGIISIMLFQHVLTASGLVQELVAIFQGTNIPIIIMLGFSSFIVGLLTGSPQGSVAVIFPILAALAPGSINTATTAYIMAIAGAMLSPAHLCLIVTGEYFKADIFKALRPVLFLEGIIIVVVMITQFTYKGYTN